MCVIAVKPKGVDLPKDDVLQSMWNTNKDGAGFMYNRNGKVHIKKGFMTFDDFKNALMETYRALQADAINLKDDVSFVYHFRIATHGTIRPENTHPFPVTDNIDELKALEFTTNLAMAHNGVISQVEADKTNDLTDTATFIKDIVAPISHYTKVHFLQIPNVLKAFGSIVGYSRLAFLDGEGNVIKVGNWQDGEDGLCYSNKNHEPKPAVTYNYNYNYSYTPSKYDKPTWFEDIKLRKLDTQMYKITYSLSLKSYNYITINKNDTYFDYYISDYGLLFKVLKKGDIATEASVYDLFTVTTWDDEKKNISFEDVKGVTLEFEQIEVAYAKNNLVYGTAYLGDVYPKPESDTKVELVYEDDFCKIVEELELKEIPVGHFIWDFDNETLTDIKDKGVWFISKENEIFVKGTDDRGRVAFMFMTSINSVGSHGISLMDSNAEDVDFYTLANIAPDKKRYPITKTRVFKNVKVYYDE